MHIPFIRKILPSTRKTQPTNRKSIPSFSKIKSNLRERCLPWRSQDKEVKMKSVKDRGWNKTLMMLKESKR